MTPISPRPPLHTNPFHFLLFPFFLLLPTQPFFSLGGWGTCTWRNGQIRFTRRTKRGRDGISFLPWKKTKKTHLFVSLKQTLFSYTVQGFFFFPTFSFSSNCISLRPFVPLTNITYFLVTFPHLSLLSSLLPSEYLSSLCSILHTPHYIYSPAPIIISFLPTQPINSTAQPSSSFTDGFLRSTRKYSHPPEPISCFPLIHPNTHTHYFSLFFIKRKKSTGI